MIVPLEFKNKKEAKKKLEEISGKNDRPNFFCPLIRNTCRTDCICYEKPNIVEFVGKYYVNEGNCKNSMFFLEILN